ncbi:hypothetical protein [Pseudoalteromonas 'SMAR']|uniref:hypothetical protein n=1 Tax=Pseudoalteromonas 'SMAR' TaxID=3416908 RepID=UPI003AF226BB
MTTYPNHRKYLKFALAARQLIACDFPVWNTGNSLEVNAFLEAVSSASFLSELSHPSLRTRLAGYHVLI